MSEVYKPGHPEDPEKTIFGDPALREHQPKALRERVTQEDIDFITVTGMFDPAAWEASDGHRNDEAACAEIERLTGKRVGMAPDEIRRSQERLARMTINGRPFSS